MYGFNYETSNCPERRRKDMGVEPLSEGLGSRNVYGSPFRDINHETTRADAA
jgi:hypothetical protein